VSITCDCSTDQDFEASPRCFSETEVTARKPWKCCECHQLIPVGTRHEAASGIWQGTWDTQRTCLPCAQIRKDYCACGWVYGGLEEAIWECLGENYITGEIADWAKEST